MGKDSGDIIYREARNKDIESLQTIVPRAFFAVSSGMKKFFPDTPTMRAWWGRVFDDYITNPNSSLPIAIDTSTNVVVGAMTLHGVLKGQPFGGFMIDHPPTEDHDKEDWPTAIMTFAEREEQVVGDRNRFLVEIVGVDQAYQGMGIGKRLVAMCCEFADAKGWPMYVETSLAREWYLGQKQGFRHVEEIVDEDAEHGGSLIREAAGTRKQT